MKGTSSVLMAEAAALALAATVTTLLDLQQVPFLSDNQQLVHFLNAPNQANLLDWRIKYYTQTFINLSTAAAHTTQDRERSKLYG
jgi:hypothetical protein